VLFPGTGHALDSVEAEKYSKLLYNHFSYLYLTNSICLFKKKKKKKKKKK